MTSTSNNRILVLRQIEGEQTKSATGLVDKRLFSGENNAEMTGDKIKLQFKPARVDFPPVMAHRKLFVVFNGLYPDFRVMTVQVQPTFWILTKGFGDPGTLEVRKVGAGKRYIAASFPAHRETPDKGVVVDWVISLDSRKKSTSELGGK